MSSFPRLNRMASAIFAALIAASSATGAALAEQKTQTKKLNASRAQVASACANAAGGFAYGTEATSGSYGCAANGGWIDCKSDGKCTGGRNDQQGGGQQPQ